MARWLIAVVTAVLVSCGGSSGPSYDGGINGAPPTGNSGFVFTPADGAGIAIGPVGCNIQGTPSQWSGLMIGFSSDPAGVCDFARAHGIQCVDVANASSTFVTIVILKGTLGSVTPVGAGTYTMNTETGDPLTELVATIGTMTDLGAACAPLATPVAGGTVTITSASAAQVTGTVDLFWTGGGFSGPFDVVGCTMGIDVCALVNGIVSGNPPLCSGCF